jgi:hypothetical protein
MLNQDSVRPNRPASSASAANAESRVQPSSSRMLTTYLSDVEQMLDEQRWEVALREAFDLPHIAVALTDPGLRSSSDRCKAWCAEWIRPDSDRTSAVESERICRMLSEREDQDTPSESVPSNALLRLRLRRHARNPPRGFIAERVMSEDPQASDAVELCTALVDGMRRWYAHSACHDATAQANLARLAVLR